MKNLTKQDYIQIASFVLGKKTEQMQQHLEHIGRDVCDYITKGEVTSNALTASIALTGELTQLNKDVLTNLIYMLDHNVCKAHSKIHELKTVAPYFEDVLSGKKKFEVRKNDRNFAAGDIVVLCEYDNDKQQYGSRFVVVKIDYVLPEHEGLYLGFCAFGITKTF